MIKRGVEMKFKKVLGILLTTTILVGGLYGCGKKSSESNGELNVFNWTEYLPQSVIDKFQEEYGIKVNYSNYSSNEELLAKVQTANEGTYDIVVPSDYMVDIMINKGLLEKIDTDKITNFKNLDEAYLNQYFDKGNEYSVPYLAGAAVIAVNKDKVKDNITSFKDLLNSKYKDSIVALDDQRALIGIALRALGYSMNEVDDKKLQEAKEYLTKLKPNIRSFDSDSPKTSMISGETSIGFMWNAEAALAYQENKNIQPVFPEEGTYLFLDNMAIPKGAKNKEAAEKFIDFILRPEITEMIAEEYPYKIVNKAAYDLLPDEYKNNKASNLPTEVFTKGEYVKDVGEATSKFDDLWNSFKQ